MELNVLFNFILKYENRSCKATRFHPLPLPGAVLVRRTDDRLEDSV